MKPDSLHYEQNRKSSQDNQFTTVFEDEYVRAMTKSVKRCYYLNYNSTDAKKCGAFNASDIPYPCVGELRERIESLNARLLKFVGAPIGSHVIITSGSTESIATVIHWASVMNNFGTVCGSSYDHSAVRENCALYNLDYVTSLDDYKLTNNCGLIFITHVTGKTGEIFDMNRFKTSILHGYTFGNKSTQITDFNHHKFLINKPIIALDVAQSITKVSIDMERWGVNALFFSLHKLGGKPGLGVLVIADEAYKTRTDPNALVFVPLIAGSQQKGSRGGTYDFSNYLACDQLFKMADDINARRGGWERAHNRMTEAGLLVYTPKERHLYNTLLISTKGFCPLGLIHDLAFNHNIYVGNVSACANEKRIDFKLNPDGSVDLEVVKLEEAANEKQYKKDPFHQSIRLSWKYPEELNDEVVNTVIEVMKSSEGYKQKE